MTASVEMEDAKRSIVDNASLLCNGINPDDTREIDDIASFPGGVIFDVDKMRDYVEKHFAIATGENIDYIEGENIKEMAKNYAMNLSVQKSSSFLVGGLLSGSLTGDFNNSYVSESNRKFSQLRVQANFGDVRLPSVLDKENLRGLVEKNILKRIDECDSPEKANYIVDAIGGAYLQRAQFGACFKMSSSSTSYESAKELSAALGAELKILSGSAEAKAKIGQNFGRKDTNLRFQIRAFGGNPVHVLAGDKDKWLVSTTEDPVIVDFDLSPISDLALRGSEAERCLLQVIKERCTEQLGKFKLVDSPVPETPPEFKGSFLLQSREKGAQYLYAENNWWKGSRMYQHPEIQTWIVNQTGISQHNQPIVTIKSGVTNKYLWANPEEARNRGEIAQRDDSQEWIVHMTGKFVEGSWKIISFESKATGLFLNVDIERQKKWGPIYQWNYPQKWVAKQI